MDKRSSLTSVLAWGLQRDKLGPGLAAGAVVALLNIFVAISFAALIFSGDLSGYVANGIGLLLLGAAVSGVLIALFSTLPGSIGSNQSVSAAIMVVVTAGMARTIPAAELAETLLPTVVVTMALTGLLFGLFCLLLGYFNLGNLVRFLPYSVIGGFLAGMGWLLVAGAIDLMAGSKPSLNQIGDLVEASVLARWLPGLLFALALIFLLERVDSFLVLPATIAVTIGLFHIIAWLSGFSVEQLRDAGWLLASVPAENLWQPWPWAAVGQVNWTAIVGQLPNLGILLVLSVVSLLLNASGLEVATEQDVSLSRELKANGVANLGIALFGGMTGHLHLSFSAISIKIAGINRLASLISPLLCLLALTIGPSFIFLLPKMMMGGLLLYLGLSFLKTWAVDTRFQLSRLEYATVLIILVVIGTVGLLEGIAVGVIAAIIFFVITYSQIDVIRQELTGRQLKSRVTRSLHLSQRLWEEGHNLYVLRLQGYIFFGTAERLTRKVRELLEPENGSSPRFILLDFTHVNGLDSTATSGLRKLKQLISADQGALIITGQMDICAQLHECGLAAGGRVHFFDTLDQGMEWYEDELLGRLGLTVADQPLGMLGQLLAVAPGVPGLEKLLPFLERLETEVGDYLMVAGDKPDSLYFVESGAVTAQLEYPNRPPLRLETMGSGRVVGEIGFYLGQARTASVIVDEAGVVYRLTLPVLDRIEREEPSAASALHHLIAHLLSQRTTHLVSALEAIER